MQLHLLKSKIHRAAVTGASLNYEGSLTIDSDLMARVGLVPHERVLCSNLANGNRFETYVIPGKRGAGEIVLNGATAHLGKPGDRLTIMSYAVVNQREARTWHPQVVVLGENNSIVTQRGTPVQAKRLPVRRRMAVA
jgi:aspartate 1-decarboxylase